MSDISAVVRNVVAWMPFAASFQIPFDVIDGAWLAAAARVIILLATWVVCYLICTWHLRMAHRRSPVLGRGILRLVFPPTQVVVSLATVLPSVLMLFFLLRIITPLTMGAVIAVALVNGLVVLLDGSWLGGKLLDARMPKILATLDDFASLQQ